MHVWRQGVVVDHEVQDGKVAELFCGREDGGAVGVAGGVVVRAPSAQRLRGRKLHSGGGRHKVGGAAARLIPSWDVVVALNQELCILHLQLFLHRLEDLRIKGAAHNVRLGVVAAEREEAKRLRKRATRAAHCRWMEKWVSCKSGQQQRSLCNRIRWCTR